MKRTVVIAHDGSRGSDTALEWGLRLARRHRAPVRIVRAFEPSTYEIGLGGGYTAGAVADLREAAERETAAARDRAMAENPDLAITSVLTVGNPERLLVDMSEHADTIVLGSRGAGAFHTLLAGSTTMHVASHAHCTVIAVPREASGPGSGVVVGVDGSPVSEAAVAYAFAQASDLRQPLVAVHSWTDPVTSSVLGAALPLVHDPVAYAQDQEVLLAESLAGWSEKFPDVPVDRRVVHGPAVPSLVKVAEGASMLVVGCRGRGAAASILLGSVSHGVLHLATCPVAVVHSH